jgi:hypothetical protein
MKLTLLFCLLPLFALAQIEYRINPDRSEERIDVVVIPPAMTADSLMYHIQGFESGEYSIEQKRKSGRLKMSHKFDTNEFYEWTKQYCIERVGERYFYENFRVRWSSFNDDPNSEIYQITYFFFPPGFHFDHQGITFKKYVFLGLDEVETPANLPDCRTDPKACDFPITREMAIKIATEQVVKGRDMEVRIKQFNPDMKWDCEVYLKGKGYRERFTIDARTGELSEPKGSHLID